MYWHSFVILILAFTYGTVARQTCEVCVKGLSEVDEHIDDECRADLNCIEDRLRDYCKNTKLDSISRFCGYIGGVENTETSILRTVSQPMKNRVPAERICEQKLNKIDGQICKIRLEKPIDLEDDSWKKQKVGNLKDILRTWGQTCDGCIEKSDFVRRIEELKPIHYTPPVRDEL